MIQDVCVCVCVFFYGFPFINRESIFRSPQLHLGKNTRFVDFYEILQITPISPRWANGCLGPWAAATSVSELFLHPARSPALHASSPGPGSNMPQGHDGPSASPAAAQKMATPIELSKDGCWGCALVMVKACSLMIPARHPKQKVLDFVPVSGKTQKPTQKLKYVHLGIDEAKHVTTIISSGVWRRP